MLSYSATLSYLDSFVDLEKTGFEGFKKEFDLDKLRAVLKRLGEPQRKYRSVHVAGTKGKGSICAFTSSILEAAGYRVGLYTSPHLSTPAERISVNGKMISKADLVRVVDHLRRYLGCSAEQKFTFFEIYTLMAISYFSMKKVDFAVFETGLGGRLDATNIIDAEVCGLSPVSYDHMHVLGGRLEQIAGEKAAIIKRGAHCVSSPQRASVMRVIEKKCREENATLALVGTDINCNIKSVGEKGSCFDLSGTDGEYKKCRTVMPGAFQVLNSATAVGICEELLRGTCGKKEAFKKGISRTFVPGRMEVLCRRPLIIIDGAQNGDSAGQLKHSIEHIFKYDRLILLLGISRDKDIRGVCRALSGLADEIILTRASVDRAADPNLIKGYFRKTRARVTQNAKEALGAALSVSTKKDLILATGSFYLIAEVRELILGGGSKWSTVHGPQSTAKGKGRG